MKARTMPTFRPKTTVEAFQWVPKDAIKYRHILKPYCAESTFPCGKCGEPYSDHGWLPHWGSGQLVCPGDMIVTGPEGIRYAMNHDAFFREYEGYVQAD